MASQLPPLPSPIAIFEQFTARQCEHIKLCERLFSWSGDSLDIELYPNKQPIFQVEGTTFSMSGRKVIQDMAGNHLFTLRKKPFSIPSVYHAEDAQGNTFFTVQGKWSFGSAKAVGTFQYKDKQTGEMREARLAMKGEFMDRRAEIRDEFTGQTVAMIDRDYWNPAQILGHLQTYIVTCAPGIDMALITAMCICLDERHNERRGNRGVVGVGAPLVVNRPIIVNEPAIVRPGFGSPRAGFGFGNRMGGGMRPGMARRRR